jgi:hypothetical protein
MLNCQMRLRGNQRNGRPFSESHRNRNARRSKGRHLQDVGRNTKFSALLPQRLSHLWIHRVISGFCLPMLHMLYFAIQARSISLRGKSRACSKKDSMSKHIEAPASMLSYPVLGYYSRRKNSFMSFVGQQKSSGLMGTRRSRAQWICSCRSWILRNFRTCEWEMEC